MKKKATCETGDEGADLVWIYKDSAQGRKQALQALRKLSESDSRCEAYKRISLVTLSRLERTQPSLAHLTALEALTVLSSSDPVDTIKRIGMEHRSLRGTTTPRAGLHPLILVLRWREALEFFQPGVLWEDIVNLSPGKARASLKTGVPVAWEHIPTLWRRWGGGALPKKTKARGESDDLRAALEEEPNAHERALVLLATSLNTSKATIRNSLSRAGVLRGLGLRPIPIFLSASRSQ